MHARASASLLDFTETRGMRRLMDASRSHVHAAIFGLVACIISVSAAACVVDTASNSANCKSQGLTEVPLESIPVSTRSLDVSRNPLGTLKNESFVTLSSLWYLYVLHAGLHTIEPDAFLGLTQLIELNMANNRIARWPDFSSSCATLQVLTLYNNILGTATNQISCLQALTDLDLHSNSIVKTFPNLTAVGHTLKTVSLYNNRISVITENDLLPLTALTRLDLIFNFVVASCAAFTALPPGALAEVWGNSIMDPAPCLPYSSEILTLYWNSVTHIPVLPACSTFKTIDFEYNLLRTIAAQAFDGCSRLEKLMLHKNSLSEFPDLTGAKDTLWLIKLDENKIHSILPSRLDALINLNSLSMNKNILTSFPNVAGPSRTLTTLTLSANAFTRIPKLDVIGASLKFLYLDDCAGLVAMHAADVAGLPRLEKLSLKRSAITAIPALSSVPPGLTIDLEGSPMKEVAAEVMMTMGGGGGLTFLLVSTPIEKLPSTCGEVSDRLDLTGTPIALCSCDMLWLKMAWDASTVTLDLPVTCSGLDWQQASPQQLYDTVCETAPETDIKGIAMNASESFIFSTLTHTRALFTPHPTLSPASLYNVHTPPPSPTQQRSPHRSSCRT
jgi:Leucine-rich repeat (LRR) protein